MAYHVVERIRTDVLIVGSGIAGLLLAHDLSEKGLNILLACKSTLLDSNTSNAQGGLAAVTGLNLTDNTQLHLDDTLSSGAGLTDDTAARMIIEGGQSLTRRLSELGVKFDTDASGRFDMALEGGHCRARILHNKDASGRAISSALVEALRANPRMRIIENCFALDLAMSDDRCLGASFLIPGSQNVLAVRARHTVLATGGLGQIFERTTNPKVATGDGIAMAYRAGARLIDMEFVQFHPTALVKDGAPAALISEAVRGAGGILLDSKGERFAFKFHKDGELATRDVVARAIYSTMMQQGLPCVWLDMRPMGAHKINDHFPNIVKTCRQWGIDPHDQPIPISPAAHYFMGGIWTDGDGQTSIPGLYAIGECASTGLHGANRLASNSLLEGGVMGMRVAEHILSKQTPTLAQIDGDPSVQLQAPYAVPYSREELAHMMFQKVGLERSATALQFVVSELPLICSARVPIDRDTAENANMALLSWLIARAALERNESRGAHQRADYPQRDDVRYQKRYYMSKDSCGWMPVRTLEAVPGVVRVPALAAR